MDTKTKTAMSDAFVRGQSTYVGKATDDTIILKSRAASIAYLDEEGGITTVYQKCPAEANTIFEITAMQDAFEVHLPPQIKILEHPFTGWGYLEKINFENVEEFGQESCAGWGVGPATTRLELHLDSAKIIGEGAFGGIQGRDFSEIYLNENVEQVGEYAFEGLDVLHYKGSLPGAPWGATEWIKD